MGQPPRLKRITLSNILSFGAEPVSLELQPLNILIGPNASGKSNLLDILRLLRAVPTNLGGAFQAGGGGEEWLWKGGNSQALASIEVQVETGTPGADDYHLDQYEISFGAKDGGLFIAKEHIVGDVQHQTGGQEAGAPSFEYTYHWDPSANSAQLRANGENTQILTTDDFRLGSQSILGQLKDPRRYAVLMRLESLFKDFAFYGEVAFDPGTAARAWVRDEPGSAVPGLHHLSPPISSLLPLLLREDCKNLPLVIGRMLQNADLKNQLLKYLQILNGSNRNIQKRVANGFARLEITEEGLRSEIGAARFSDGTLKWLCLLAILLADRPPPLVCIDEPEIGLHPDILPTLARLLLQASTRMQLVVATHSDILVDALNETPECIVVMEKREGATTSRRLSKEALAEWLEDYTLGDLWNRGVLGGNRW